LSWRIRADIKQMDNKITTYSTLYNLVDLDLKDHMIKDLAMPLLEAMNDWTPCRDNISEFTNDLKSYFGTPLTIESISNKKFDTGNAWKMEAGSSIVKLIKISTKLCNESEFDKIVENVLDYYNQEFSKVDFIAELNYLTTEQGGRSTPAISGYRPQIKFEFSEMQTSGQQTFVNIEKVLPGDNVDAKIKIVSPDYFEHSLREGMEFEFREGARIIGTGKIKYIVNDKLQDYTRRK
jgi:hypothetical protein